MHSNAVVGSGVAYSAKYPATWKRVCESEIEGVSQSKG
jgi:hypothetical protein